MATPGAGPDPVTSRAARVTRDHPPAGGRTRDGESSEIDSEPVCQICYQLVARVIDGAVLPDSRF